MIEETPPRQPWPGSGRVRRGAAAQRSGRAPRIPFAILVSALVVGGLGLLLLLNTASAANEVRRHDLASQDAGIAAQVEQLQNDVAASAAPSNLAAAAGALGMVPGANPAFLVVEPNGTVQVLGSAAPASGVPIESQLPAKPKPKPKTTPPASSSAAHSSPGASTGKSGAAHSSGHSSTPAGHASGHPSTTPPPTPTPTPTPTLVLPGGNR